MLCLMVDDSRNFKREEMKNKLINNFTSRPFIVLIIAVVAFFTKSEAFPAWALISTFGLYCGYNLGNKFVKKECEYINPNYSAKQKYPTAQEIAEEVMNIPIYPENSAKQGSGYQPKHSGDPEQEPPKKP